MSSPHNIQNNVHTDSPEKAYEKILQIGGASLVRDAVDIHVLKNVKSGNYAHKGSNGSTHGIIDSQNDAGGFPELRQGNPLSDSDNDGMPDEWEIRNRLNPNISDAIGRDLDKNYDNIEVYFNELVKKLPIVNKLITMKTF